MAEPLDRLVTKPGEAIVKAAHEGTLEAARHAVEMMRGRLAAGLDADGRRLRRLSPSYARRVRRTEMDTRSIASALRVKKRAGGHSVVLRSATTRTGQSLNLVASWHQTGLPGRRPPLPQRRVIGLTDAEVRQLTSEYALRIARRIPDETVTVQLRFTL